MEDFDSILLHKTEEIAERDRAIGKLAAKVGRLEYAGNLMVMALEEAEIATLEHEDGQKFMKVFHEAIRRWRNAYE